MDNLKVGNPIMCYSFFQTQCRFLHKSIYYILYLYYVCKILKIVYLGNELIGNEIKHLKRHEGKCC